MTCNNCKEITGRMVFKVVNEKVMSFCDRCDATLGSFKFPDVYLEKEGYNTNLWNKEKNEPYRYHTRSEKAAIMRKLGVIEAGDRVKGAR